nr:hypothetical protein Iba_chr01aCG6420 [Ipomoea batatas]GMC49327.1 hypothetical protein Iba_chr01bCG6800 [Ipomoea batatas]GMC52922.1 hypothetical protein Iba_chr01dCG1870 [Ipomoea batatas]
MVIVVVWWETFGGCFCWGFSLNVFNSSGFEILDGKEQYQHSSWPSYHWHSYSSGLCRGSSVCTTSSTRRNIWCTARSDVHDKVVGDVVHILSRSVNIVSDMCALVPETDG